MKTHPMKQGTYTVSSGYGPRWGTFHAGLDFAAPIGTPIYAAEDGYVVEGKDRTGVSGFGSWIWLDCQAACGKDFIYGHVKHSGILVTAGDRVKAGQQIGVVGNEGESTGPHLHFEVWGPPGRVGGAHSDPAVWLKGAAQPGAATPPKPQGGNLSNYFDVDWSARFHFGGPRSTSGIQRVVIHTTENAAGTPAENVANYQITSRSGSYHVLVDTTGKRLRENTDDWITWSVGNNAGNVHGLNLSFVAQAAWSRAAWLAQERMLRQGATVVAHWCKTYNIPVQKVGTARGICGHGDLRVFGGTDHTDPGGNFPWDVFTRYVNEAISGTIQGGFLMALSDAEQRELLDKTRDIHRELKQLYPSRSAYRTTDKPIDTLAGMVLNADARIHEDWVHARAAELGITPTEFAKKLGGK